MSDLAQMDLYDLFGVSETCTESDIRTAFRKKALECHPDKFPNDEEKKERFLLIKRALELLSDATARKTYDECRRQKKIQAERLSQMDEKRKKFKSDLDRKEREASRPTKPTVDRFATNRLNAEIDRLRREGNHLVDEELENLRVIIEKDKQKAKTTHPNAIIKYAPGAALYTDGELQDIFRKYGNISTIVNRPPKRALVEFNDEHISSIIEHEKGFPDRPFASVKLQTPASTTSATGKPAETVDLTKPDFEDFEAMMMRKMAQHAATS